MKYHLSCIFFLIVTGRYCMFKIGTCPLGFRDGWLYWDDAAPWFGDTIQNQSGKFTPKIATMKY